jgi:hypothetical protein
MTPLDRINAYTAHRMGIMTKEERDRITAEMASLWDDGKGIPAQLFDKRREALKQESFDDR